MTTLKLEVFTTTNVKASMNHYTLNSICYRMETSARVSALRNLIQPLLVILKDDGVVVKAKPVLPHMDHHAHSSAYESQLSESVYVSAISTLWACQQPTGRADMHYSPGHSLCITFPSAPPWLDVVSSSLLSAWLSEESPRLQQGQLEATAAVLEPSCWTTCLNISLSYPLVLTHMKQTCTFLPNGWMHTYCTVCIIPTRLSISLSCD